MKYSLMKKKSSMKQEFNIRPQGNDMHNGSRKSTEDEKLDHRDQKSNEKPPQKQRLKSSSRKEIRH